MSSQFSLGAAVSEADIRFSVWSGSASRLWVSLFDADGDRETQRLEMSPVGDGLHSLTVHGLRPGVRYGFRAEGAYDPERGQFLDPDKLLMDPYAFEIDRPYVYDARLAERRGQGMDTAPLMPKAIAVAVPDPLPLENPVFQPGGLIYEIAVGAFTRLHPEVPDNLRGTIGALAHPAIIEHLRKLGVTAVELMPITAAIDERHLPPLGLRNAWGYNPVTFMALDPRLAPGGFAELRETAAVLRQAGIGVILDLVFNHTGEGDELGPTLSLRGLDNAAYYRHVRGAPGTLVNDTGTGNTVAVQHPVVQEMILGSLRRFVVHGGVDGFRFDLATILGRGDNGFDPHAPLLEKIRTDPILASRILIAEPWDVGPDGYQLGNFGDSFLEWNDHYRDDVRRFWRGDRGVAGKLATRLAGSSDIFSNGANYRTRTVNFVAAHDGMTLADLVRYERKHNEANGERNHDGHNDNFSWNNGIEGESSDPQVAEDRYRDQLALLSTLFASRGTIMLTAGDEFGRTQKGNNNAYAQDNEVTWLDWSGRDLALERHVIALAELRRQFPLLADPSLLKPEGSPGSDDPHVEWLSETGRPLTVAGWQDPRRHRITMVLSSATQRIAVIINGDWRGTVFSLPMQPGYEWKLLEPADGAIEKLGGESAWRVPGRTVVFATQRQAQPGSDHKESAK